MVNTNQRIIISYTEPSQKNGLYQMVLKDPSTDNHYRADWTKNKFEQELLKDKLVSQGANYDDLDQLVALAYEEGEDNGYEEGYEMGSEGDPYQGN